MPSYLGVDVGTTMTKAVLFDAGGAMLACAERATRLRHPGGDQVEQDIEEVVRSVGAVIAELAGGEPPALLAITGQGDGCWLTDNDGHGVRPAVSWMDGRAAEIVSGWENDGTAEEVYRCNGNMLFPGAAAPVLRWLAEHEPETLTRASTAGYCKDVVLHRLTGLRATDPSDASLPFGSPGSAAYSADVLRLCGLESHVDLLPDIVRPGPRAALHAAGAELTGLPVGTPVSCGPFDLPACAVGAGVTGLGDGLLTIGTTLACQVLVDTVDTTGEPAGMHLATARPDRWLRAMPAMVGTASLDWALDLLDLEHTALDDVLAATAPGARGVEMLPYLAPSGERAPFVDPAAHGQLTGLRLGTEKADIVRAVCEGIAFAARDCFEAATLDGELAVCGGGARSEQWLRIFADVLGRPVRVIRLPGVGARGAVLSAAPVLDAAAWTEPDAVLDPDPAGVAHYAEAFDRYRANRDAARPLWRRQPLRRRQDGRGG